ncbi:DUF4126 domain-containing protein [Sphingomonas sp.]|uniref:DUF4126 domain-containing protein n=1 Tax=Sphingomonas sp. TaxID=28214 RepID=UPI003B3A6A34
MAPAAISFAARYAGLDLGATPLAVLGYRWTPWILGLLACGELISDQLPTTPSRKVPAAFAARLITGGVSGGAIGAAHGLLWPGGIAGVVGAVIGTLGGAAGRARLAAAFGRDRPAAILEDVIAIIVAGAIVMAAA